MQLSNSEHSMVAAALVNQLIVHKFEFDLTEDDPVVQQTIRLANKFLADVDYESLTDEWVDPIN